MIYRNVVVAPDPVPGNPGPGPVRSGGSVLIRLLVAGLLLVGAVAAWRWHTMPAYIGTSRVIDVQWRCADSLNWTDTEPQAHWYYRGRVPLKPIVVWPNGAHEPQIHRGTIHFDTADRATFTSNHGGSVELQRARPNQMFPLNCTVR